MLPFNITFQAYIPKNLGQPLLNYFANDSRFHPDRMKNYQEFRRMLTSSDIVKHRWLREAVYNSLYDTYCAIDDGIFHSKGNSRHPNHSTRLQVDLRIDPDKIGNHFSVDKMWYLPHQAHADGTAGNQHSGESHQVQAYIRDITTSYGVSPLGLTAPSYKKHEGICGRVQIERSAENPIQVTVWDKKSNSLCHRRPSKKMDSTRFDITASAGYPFIKKAFHINFNFTVDVHLAERSNTVHINVEGTHDKFPAYELLVDDTIIYTHAHTSLGFAGLAIPAQIFHPFQASYSKTVHRWGK